MSTEVESAVGARSFQRGRSYARSKRVRSVEWDPSAETLTGSVVGNGALYDTAAFFVGGGGGALAFEDGECTCPVGHNCKHVAAIVIAATDARSGARLGRAARTGATVARPAPSWETSLRALIDPPAGANGREPAGDRADVACERRRGPGRAAIARAVEPRRDGHDGGGPLRTRRRWAPDAHELSSVTDSRLE
jgi:SWIM zinc finger